MRPAAKVNAATSSRGNGRAKQVIQEGRPIVARVDGMVVVVPTRALGISETHPRKGRRQSNGNATVRLVRLQQAPRQPDEPHERVETEKECAANRGQLIRKQLLDRVRVLGGETDRAIVLVVLTRIV